MRDVMVQVYALDIVQLPDPKNEPECMEGLSEVRIERILKYQHEKGRRQSLGAGLLLKEVLHRFGKGEAHIRFGQNGKPETEGIYFNISHSGNLVICAVSDLPVGCDVEVVGTYHEGVVRRFFSEKEKFYLENIAVTERSRAFYRIWTARESYMKLTGEGMRLELSEFEVELVGSKVDDKWSKIIRKGCCQSCNIKEYIYNDYQIAVCAEENTFCDELQWIVIAGGR